MLETQAGTPSGAIQARRGALKVTGMVAKRNCDALGLPSLPDTYPTVLRRLVYKKYKHRYAW